MSLRKLQIKLDLEFFYKMIFRINQYHIIVIPSFFLKIQNQKYKYFLKHFKLQMSETIFAFMKFKGLILFILYTCFLLTPFTMLLIEKDSIKTSIFSGIEDEKESETNKNEIVLFTVNNEVINLYYSTSIKIISENLSKHPNVSSQVTIPPPKLV